jgi:hypothetical protein
MLLVALWGKESWCGLCGGGGMGGLVLGKLYFSRAVAIYPNYAEARDLNEAVQA